jgi:thymidylate synthase
MRSNDLFKGLPYNLIQFTTLQEIIAGWLRIEVGSYNHISDSLHLYESEFQDALAYEPAEQTCNEDDLRLPSTNQMPRGKKWRNVWMS